MTKNLIKKNKPKHLSLVVLICFLQVIYSISLIGSLFLVSYTIQAASNPNDALVMFYQLVILPDAYSLPIWLLLLYLLIGFSVISIVLNFTLSYLKVYVTAKIRFYTRNHISNYINNLAYDQKIKTKSNWLSWYTNDTDTIIDQGFSGFFNIFSSCVQILFGLIVLALLHWILLIVSFILVVCGILFPLLFKKYLEKNYQNLSKANEDWVAKNDQLLKLYNSVYFWNKLLVVNKLLKDESQIVANKSLKSFYNIFKVYILGSILISYTSQAIVFVIAVLIVILPPHLGVAIIIGSYTISANLFVQLFQFSQYLSEFLGAKAIWHKFKFKPDQTKKSLNGLTSIKINLSSINYDNRTINKHFDLLIEKSNKTLIIGPSGSGKSSLIKVITGELNNYSGTISANEINYQALNLNSLHYYMWLIGAGNYHFFKDATLKDNITLFDKKINEDLLDNALKRSQLVSLQTRLNDFISLDSKIPYSEGQLQQIELARFFYHANLKKLLLIDESLANIDVEKREIIQNNLLEDQSFALVEVSHHFDENLKEKFNQVIKFEVEV